MRIRGIQVINSNIRRTNCRENKKLPRSTLKIIYIAGYNGALPYVKKRLEEICAPKHIKEDRTLENRRIVFEEMEKKNIPDIVIDMSESDQERQRGYLKMFCARINPF